MFDPIREFTHGDAFQRTDSLLERTHGRGLRRSRTSTASCPHHLAVCVTKLDDPRVFKTAQDLGMLIPDDTSDWGFPRVHETDAQALFQALGRISKSGNGEAVPRLFERYFHPERISYYVTSAVGFMVNKRTRRFDPRDTENVYRTASGASSGPRPGAPDQRGRAGPVDRPAAGPGGMSIRDDEQDDPGQRPVGAEGQAARRRGLPHPGLQHRRPDQGEFRRRAEPVPARRAQRPCPRCR